MNQYVDAEITPEDLEDALLEIKTVDVVKRNVQNEAKANYVKWGFVLLIAAMASSLILIVVTEILGT